ncbi:MAG: diguanylate cyclase [Pseudomonadota bacterium]|nr:diguanylate cyclase [Pseudomonadota bacterium]
MQAPSSSALRNMNASIGIRAPDGMFFGTLQSIEGRRLLIELNADLVDGETVEARIVLVPSASSVLLTGRAERVSGEREGEVPRYLVHVVDLSPADQSRLASWCDFVLQGGTLSDFDSLAPVDIPVPRSNPSVEGPFGRWEEPPSTGRVAVRQALRTALRRAADRAPGASAAPSGTLNPPPSAASTAPPRAAAPSFLDSFPATPPPRANRPSVALQGATPSVATPSIAPRARPFPGHGERAGTKSEPTAESARLNIVVGDLDGIEPVDGPLTRSIGLELLARELGDGLAGELASLRPTSILLAAPCGGDDIALKFAGRLASLDGLSGVPIGLIGSEGAPNHRLAAARAGLKVYLQRPVSASRLASAAARLEALHASARVLVHGATGDTRVPELAAMLASVGSVEQSTGDLTSGLEEIARARPDLIVLSAGRDPALALALCAVLRGATQGHLVPVVVVGEADDSASFASALAAGADDYLPRETEPALIVARVRARCDRAKSVNSQASVDPLTGFHKRSSFLSALDARVAEAGRTWTNLAVVVFDIVQLRSINAGFGHRAGDAILSGLARICGGHLRPDDLRGRVGDDELGLALYDVDADAVLALLLPIANEIRTTEFAAPGGPGFGIEVRVGVARYPENGFDAKTLLKAAMGDLRADRWN